MYVFLAYKIIQFNFHKILLLLLSLLQSVSVHDPSSAVCTYYPYCSLCLYIFLLLQSVHIIPIAVCTCHKFTTLLLQSVPYILSPLQSVSVHDLLLLYVHISPIAVCTCHNPSSAARTIHTYYPYCSLCLYVTFFCSLYILALLQSVHVTTLLLQPVPYIHIIPTAVCVCT
jgi:hypothetical protein